MSNIHRQFDRGSLVEVLGILTALQASNLHLASLDQAMPLTTSGIVFLLFTVTWRVVRQALSRRCASTANSLQAMGRSLRDWALTCATAGFAVMSGLSLPASWMLATLASGWVTLTLLAMTRTRAWRSPGDAIEAPNLIGADGFVHPTHFEAPSHRWQILLTPLHYFTPSDRSEPTTRPSQHLRPANGHACPPCNRPLGRFAKRTVDLVGAAIGVLALLPVFIACALTIKLTSRGPIFFRQRRMGRDGAPFNCLKFRSMRVGAEQQLDLLRPASIQDGPAFKMPDDPRVTWIGRWLRKYSLDELPQIFNVLLGDMSLVGPRPPLLSEVAEYEAWQLRRLSIKPGLTCIWQVWGRNRVSFDRWIEMDIAYIDNWSIWLDIKLILHTVPALVRGSGM